MVFILLPRLYQDPQTAHLLMVVNEGLLNLKFLLPRFLKIDKCIFDGMHASRMRPITGTNIKSGP